MSALSCYYAVLYCIWKGPPKLISSILAENKVSDHGLERKRAFMAGNHENASFHAQNWISAYGHITVCANVHPQ
jgi:hypothetical protein